MNDGSGHGFAIDGELSIYRAAELAQALQLWVQQLPEMVQPSLDLSAVTEMDSAGLQLLLSLHKTLRAQGMELTITAASEAVRDVLALTGVLQGSVAAEDAHEL